MKIQDIFFIILLVLAIFKLQEKHIVIMGIICLLIAIPLFTAHVFFTAERFTWYAAAFFLLAIIKALRESYENRN